MAHYLFNFSRKSAKGRSLREQAAELLHLKLWGIGAKTPNRNALSPGDRVVIYVGAPEYEFIGHAEIATRVQPWTDDEAARYPGSFESGVVFRESAVWPHPAPIKALLPRLELSRTNPGARFFSGVVRITESDFETVLGAGAGTAPTAAGPTTVHVPAAPSREPTVSEGPIHTDLLFKTVEKLKKVGSSTLSEYDTRAEFIDKYLEALGYTEFGDIQRGSPVESGNFPDYVLRIRGKPAIAIEAKRLGSPLGPKEAAQVVAYCSNLGVRWGAVSDGRYFKLYDAPMLGVQPEERQVLAVDMADYKDRSDFEARVYPELELIAKMELESGAGLERRVALEAVRELLSSTSSSTTRALRKELRDRRGINLSPAELSELASELVG